MSNDGQMYMVSLSYEFSTITVGVHAVNEAVAEEEAIELLEDEWGPKVHDYMDCTITTNE